MLKLMTYNIKNNYKEKTFKRIDKIINIIKEEDTDIIGLQEVNFKVKKYLKNNLKEYQIFGKSRYENNKIYDEYNTILVKKNITVLKTETYKLYPKHKHAFFSFFPRIATQVSIKHQNKEIHIFNTHLDVLFNYTRKKELEILNKKITKSENTIIMGDFNMEPQNKIFQKFTSHYKNINTVVPTNIHHKLPIDYILISNNITYESAKIINSKVMPSDHFPITVIITNL